MKAGWSLQIYDLGGHRSSKLDFHECPDSELLQSNR